MSILFDYDEDPTKPRNFKRDQRSTREKQLNNQSKTAAKYDDLLVFGYECKLFRDDAIAEEVNCGKNLIPWMGNNDLLIDRYDCRGHLYRLEDFDFELKPEIGQSDPDETDVENILDEERYKDLNKDMIEEDILQEEEEKRSQNLYDSSTAYQTIGFTYNSDETSGQSLSDMTFNEDAFQQYCQYYGYDSSDKNVRAYFQGQSYQYDYERPPPPPEAAKPQESKQVAYEKFQPPEGLDIPEKIEVPETRKMQSIIERTAGFISKQSVQMEIVLKTKQSGNPQFNFLNFDNYLNPYYKFILGKIKEGLYTPVDDKDKENDEEEKEKTEERDKDESDEESSDEDDDDDNGGELHPLLQAHKRPVTITTKPNIQEEFNVTENEPKTTTTTTSKPAGNVEDMARIYMTLKYKSNPDPENETSLSESKDRHENNDEFIDRPGYDYRRRRQSVTELPPPPPPGLEPPQHVASMQSYGFPPPPPPPTSFHDVNTSYESVRHLLPLPPPPAGMHMDPRFLHRFPRAVMGPPGLEFPDNNKELRPRFDNPHLWGTLHRPRLSSDVGSNQFAPHMNPEIHSTHMPPLMHPNMGSASSVFPMIPIQGAVNHRYHAPRPHPDIFMTDDNEEPVIAPYDQPLPIRKSKSVEDQKPLESLAPPGVDQSVGLLSLPPPPPLPLPPSIDNLFKKRQKAQGEGDKDFAQKSFTSTYKEENFKNIHDTRPYADETQRKVSLENVLRKSNRYEPSPLLSDILKRTTESSAKVGDEDPSESPPNARNKERKNEGRGKLLYKHSPTRYTGAYDHDCGSYSPTHYRYKENVFERSRPHTSANSLDVIRPELSNEKPVNDSYLDDTSTFDTPPDDLKCGLSYPYGRLPSSQFSLAEDNSSAESPFVVLDNVLKTIQKVERNREDISNSLNNARQETPQNDQVIPPSPDFQSVIDRLALYVAKNGEEFEAGIKEKNDPRFDFLNPWNVYYSYYLEKKKNNLEELERQQQEEAERRKNLKVSFGLKKTVKLNPSSQAKKTKPSTPAIFNLQDDDDDEDAEQQTKDGFQPNRDLEVCAKKKLEKKIEEKDQLLRSLQDHSLLQEKVQQVNKISSKQQTSAMRDTSLTPQENASLKRKLQTEAYKESGTLITIQGERRKKAASFVDMLKKKEDSNISKEPVTSSSLRKRQFRETGKSSDGEESIPEQEKGAFFQAINQAFKGN